MPFLKKDEKPHLKRLIICCDGTWQNSDSPNLTKHAYTNITRISRAIKSNSDRNVPQIVFYQNGVGTDVKGLAKLIAGTTGLGIGANIQEAYMFLANNYHPGDEIFLFGFSRGAYTARSLAGLIGQIGVLTKKGMEDFPRVYRDYKNKNLRNQEYVTNQKDWERIKGVKIKAIGCWDTVGALGIPSNKPLVRMREKDKYNFHDVALAPGIENAFHAIALDEARAPFMPTLWRKTPGPNRGDEKRTTDDDHDNETSVPLPASNSYTNQDEPVNTPTVLRQVWFPGCHTNIGGGYLDQEIADMTLFWMIDQLDGMLSFDREYLNTMHGDPDVRMGDDSTHWANGTIYNSFKGFTVLCGKSVRTPGGYYSKEVEKERVQYHGRVGTSNEEIHPSVRARIVHTNGDWWPTALSGWRCFKRNILVKGRREMRWVWQNPVSNRILRESMMGKEEEALAGLEIAKQLQRMEEADMPEQKHF